MESNKKKKVVKREGYLTTAFLIITAGFLMFYGILFLRSSCISQQISGVIIITWCFCQIVLSQKIARKMVAYRVKKGWVK